MLAQRLLLGWVSGRPEEVRGVACSPVESVLTAGRLRWVPGAQANSGSEADLAEELPEHFANLLAAALLTLPPSNNFIIINNINYLRIKAASYWGQWSVSLRQEAPGSE